MEQCDIDALVKSVTDMAAEFVKATLIKKQDELKGIDSVIGEVEKLLELKL